MAVVTDVLRDLEEPRELVVGNDTAPETALRIEERRLHRVLRFLARAKPAQAEAEDPRRVPLIEQAGRVSGRDLGEGSAQEHSLWNRFVLLTRGAVSACGNEAPTAGGRISGEERMAWQGDSPGHNRRRECGAARDPRRWRSPRRQSRRRRVRQTRRVTTRAPRGPGRARSLA